jgi:hypothetical protein
MTRERERQQLDAFPFYHVADETNSKWISVKNSRRLFATIVFPG